jgi:hypothetical protein
MAGCEGGCSANRCEEVEIASELHWDRRAVWAPLSKCGEDGGNGNSCACSEDE